jgi:hypothetical protein
MYCKYLHGCGWEGHTLRQSCNDFEGFGEIEIEWCRLMKNEVIVNKRSEVQNEQVVIMKNGMQSFDDVTATKLRIHHLKYFCGHKTCKFCACGSCRKYGTYMVYDDRVYPDESDSARCKGNAYTDTMC